VRRQTGETSQNNLGTPHGRDARATAKGERYGFGDRQGPQKRVSIFDELSPYVVENKGSEKRTKPNEAN
jgi:hypothetical protein